MFPHNPLCHPLDMATYIILDSNGCKNKGLIIVLFRCYNHGKCTKYETCAKLGRGGGGERGWFGVNVKDIILDQL